MFFKKKEKFTNEIYSVYTSNGKRLISLPHQKAAEYRDRMSITLDDDLWIAPKN